MIEHVELVDRNHKLMNMENSCDFLIEAQAITIMVMILSRRISSILDLCLIIIQCVFFKFWNWPWKLVFVFLAI